MLSGVFQLYILTVFTSVIIVGKSQVVNNKHVFKHPAVVIDFSSIEYACDDSNAPSISSDMEQDVDERSRGGTWKVGGQTRWILLVCDLFPGSPYNLHFKWFLADEQLGVFDSVISTVTNSYVTRMLLTESVQSCK
jgi:hypothetical protein